jgi:2-hydroxycyclohexanecarboxyl-CoA dehydrogenase
MDLNLRGRAAIITGGASGIGRTTAEYFRREGIRLVLADRSADALEAVRAELAAQGAEVVTATVDVRSYDECEGLVARAVDAFGGVDILVNSAGISGAPLMFTETSPADWAELIGINLVGTLNCCKAVSRHMIARGGGRIVNLGSEAGKANEKRIVVYGATKGGVIALTKGLAVELGRHQITVNAVCPGVTMTPMNAALTPEMEREWARMYPLGRLGRAEDIAPLITFLAAPEASWITAQAISVSGGWGRA